VTIERSGTIMPQIDHFLEQTRRKESRRNESEKSGSAGEDFYKIGTGCYLWWYRSGLKGTTIKLVRDKVITRNTRETVDRPSGKKIIIQKYVIGPKKKKTQKGLCVQRKLGGGYD